MYEIRHEPSQEFPYYILDENGTTAAQVRVIEDAREIVAALNLVVRATINFPGLVDGETSVSGADLVDLFNEALIFDDKGRFKERDGN